MRVMVFGTFDNLHPGHLDYFRQALVFGDEIIAVIARDKNVLAIKGHLPQENEQKRLRKVESALTEISDKGRTVLGDLKNRWLVIEKYCPNVICLGYDQKVDADALKREIDKSRLFCEVKRLTAYQPDKYKSSFCLGE